MKDVQATAFSPRKRTSRTWNMKRLNFLPFAWVIFALLDPDPDPADQNQCGSIGIHYPEPQH